MYHPTDMRRGIARSVYKRLMVSLLHRHATHILACSKTILEAVRRSHCGFHQNNGVIYLGVELERFTASVSKKQVRKQFGLPLDTPVVIYVARFAPHKNHAQIVRVADLLARQGFNAHFVMAGSHGPLLLPYQEAANDRADISVLTNVGNIAPLLGATDLFFFPSLSEGFGMVAIEAAAAGLPIVASDLPAVREACPPSHRAFMFPPNDDEAAAKSIVQILDEQALRERLSLEAKEWAARFSIAESVRALTQVYEEQLEGFHRG
jgi:glycosyltransferase involved in cell wall biosynthesis